MNDEGSDASQDSPRRPSRGPSRRALLATTGATLGAFALGGRVSAAGRPVVAASTQGGPVRFPEGFLWATASAAHQVEGAIAADGRGPSIWDVFSHTPGKTVNGDTGDVACEQYYLYERDFDLMAALGFPAYRFSISWSRIQPSGRGSVNQPGLDHYQRLVEALLRRGIAPFVTIYHWDLPQALQEEVGGWTARETAERYAEYAAIVYDALADRVPHFLCLNEPSSQGWLGYGLGDLAPGETSAAAALQASHYQLLGQGLAVRAMRTRRGAGGAIGTTLDLWAVRPASDSAADIEAARFFDGQWNRWYLDPIFRGSYPADMVAAFGRSVDLSFIQPGDLSIIATPLDFLGVNYYTDRVIAANPGGSSPHSGRLGRVSGGTAGPSGSAPYQVIQPVPPQVQLSPSGFIPATEGVTAMGWQVAPGGMTEVLVRVRDEYTAIPLYVTETGAAYDDYVEPSGEIKDPERIAFLEEYLRAVHAAIARGVDVRGLIVWSFQDNFASTNGYSKKFGLVWTDFATQQRTPKQSASWYRDVIARNGLA